MNFVTNVYKKYMQHENENKAIEKENRPITIDEPIKPRRSVLECFDPLCTNSPVKPPTKKPQIIIECSSGEENGSTVMENSDNENEEYQDANINITLSRETEKIAEDSIHEKFFSLTLDDSEQIDLSKSDLDGSSTDNVKNLSEFNIPESTGSTQNASQESEVVDIKDTIDIMPDSLEIEAPENGISQTDNNGFCTVGYDYLPENHKDVQHKTSLENDLNLSKSHRDSGIANGSNLTDNLSKDLDTKTESECNGLSNMQNNQSINEECVAKGFLNDNLVSTTLVGVGDVVIDDSSEQNIKKVDYMIDSLELSQIIENCTNDQTIEHEIDISLVAESVSTEGLSKENSLNESKNISSSESNKKIDVNKQEIEDINKNDERNEPETNIFHNIDQVNETNNTDTIIIDCVQNTVIQEENNTDSGIQEIIENQINHLNDEPRQNCEEDKHLNTSIKRNDDNVHESKIPDIKKENVIEKMSIGIEESATLNDKLMTAQNENSSLQVEQEISDSIIDGKFDMDIEKAHPAKESSFNITECLNETAVIHDKIKIQNQCLLQDSINNSGSLDNEHKTNYLTEETKELAIRQEKDILNLQEKNAELSKTAEIAIKKYKNYENELQQLKEELARISHEKDKEIVNLKEEITKAANLAKNEQQAEYEKNIEELKNENSKLQDMVDKLKSKNAETNLTEDAKLREQELCNELNGIKAIMVEYEKAMESMMRDHQKLKEEYKLTTSHFATLESAFSDLNQRYERSKAVAIAYKENEEILLKSVKSLEESLALQKNKYEALKQHAKTQIESSNKEILATKEQYQTEYTKLKAFVKRLEIKCASLESSLAQKTQECAALSELCDEVTRK